MKKLISRFKFGIFMVFVDMICLLSWEVKNYRLI